MEEIEAPERLLPDRTYRCCCRLTNERVNGKRITDSCAGFVSGPDEPICGECINAGHPQMPEFDPAIPGRQP